MRRFLFPLLLATSVVATPAFAQQWNKQDRQAVRQQARQDRQQSHEQARPQAPRPQPNVQAARPEFAAPGGGRPYFAPQRGARPDPQQWSRPAPMAEPGRPSFAARYAEPQQWSRPAPATVRPRAGFDGQQAGDSVATWRQQQRDEMRQQRMSRGFSGVPARVAPPSYARPDQPAPIPRTAYNYNPAEVPQWSTNWRYDHRYDWRDYRERHRSIFQIGVYYDPFGWGYQRWGIGWTLWPAYYDQSYWIQDPYMYDLPYAPWPYEWVRYYDDALLVNVFTGQVVDVIDDFFW